MDKITTLTELTYSKFIEINTFVTNYKKEHGEVLIKDCTDKFGEKRFQFYLNMLQKYDEGKIDIKRFNKAILYSNKTMEIKYWNKDVR
jgi:hypothetical protein